MGRVPVDETHRRECLNYTRSLMATERDPALPRLLEFFAATPLYN